MPRSRSLFNNTATVVPNAARNIRFQNVIPRRTERSKLTCLGCLLQSVARCAVLHPAANFSGNTVHARQSLIIEQMLKVWQGGGGNMSCAFQINPHSLYRMKHRCKLVLNRPVVFVSRAEPKQNKCVKWILCNSDRLGGEKPSTLFYYFNAVFKNEMS